MCARSFLVIFYFILFLRGPYREDDLFDKKIYDLKKKSTPHPEKENHSTDRECPVELLLRKREHRHVALGKIRKGTHPV